jgi:hypothetical protein
MPGRLAVLAALVALLCLPAAASGADFAPVDRAGPALTQKAALDCSPGVDRAARAPVLLNPATGVTVEENYGWNWERSLTAAGIPWCAYDAPQHTLGDIQTSGELLVDAIRTMHARAGRRIAIMGHSQGGMSMRWALRFWPDTRAMVDDVIGFAGSNHGTTLGNRSGCAQSPGCPAASLQQAADAEFIKALNSRQETFSGVSYTNVYTHNDEVVMPSTGPAPSSALRTGDGAITNVATQDVCPAEVFEHLLVGTVSPSAYALAIDALSHPGPADPARVDRAVCAQLYQPGVDPASASTYTTALSAAPGLLSVPIPGVVLVEGVERLRAEPPLRCYVLAAGCGTATPTATSPSKGAGVRCASRRRFTIHVPSRLRRVRVTVAGRRVAVRRGRAVVDLRGRPREAVTVKITGRTARGRTRTQTRRYRTCTRRGAV